MEAWTEGLVESVVPRKASANPFHTPAHSSLQSVFGTHAWPTHANPCNKEFRYEKRRKRMPARKSWGWRGQPVLPGLQPSLEAPNPPNTCAPLQYPVVPPQRIERLYMEGTRCAGPCNTAARPAPTKVHVPASAHGNGSGTVGRCKQSSCGANRACNAVNTRTVAG